LLGLSETPNSLVSRRTRSCAAVSTTKPGAPPVPALSVRFTYFPAGTPPVTYTYDDTAVPNSFGRLTATSTAASTTNIVAYDALGRIKQSKQTTAATPYPFTYSYNLAGNLEIETYPSGRAVTACYDSGGRLATVVKSCVRTAIIWTRRNLNPGFSVSGEVRVIENYRYDKRQARGNGFGYRGYYPRALLVNDLMRVACL
jgi:YD repeat-containing protein